MVNSPMAYRRKAGITRAATFKDELYNQHQQSQLNKDDHVSSPESPAPHHLRIHSDGGGSPSLAARAIRASAAHRDASAYGYAYSPTAAGSSVSSSSSPPAAVATASSSSSSLSSSSSSAAPPPSKLSCSSSVVASSLPDSSFFRSYSFPEKGCYEADSPSTKDNNDSQYGFWGVLASKAKSVLQEDDFQTPDRIKSLVIDPSSGSGAGPQIHQHSYQSSEGGNKVDNAKLRKRLDALTSSLSNLGDTHGNALEEGHTVVEHKPADITQETHNKTADTLQETRKIQIRRRGGSTDTQDQPTVVQNTSWQRSVLQPVQTNSLANQETQLKASRDVAMATAAKAKVLLRELKTVKADLAFAKERCSQLEEENKRLRESRVKGDNPADDDLIRLQLETLLAEKARLGHENSIYARENRFLREIVEYHQLTTQDVVYLDDGTDEVADAYTFYIGDKVLCSTPTSPISPGFFQEMSSLNFTLPLEMKEYPPKDHKDVFDTTTSQLSQSRSPPKRKESAHAIPSSQGMEDEQAQTAISRTPICN